MDAALFVKAGGRLAQLGLILLVADMTPVTTILQLLTPAAIVRAETEMMAGKVNAVMPAQPETVMLDPAPNVRPAGSVSINPIPTCAGLPGILVIKNVRVAD